MTATLNYTVLTAENFNSDEKEYEKFLTAQVWQ